MHNEPADFSPLTVPKPLPAARPTRRNSSIPSRSARKHSIRWAARPAISWRRAKRRELGPNLFGLFRPEARAREVAEGEGHRFQVKARRDYLHRSIRTPADQLAVAESGPTRGQAYLPVMPPFAKDVLSDKQIDALGDYLATLNEPAIAAPW